ncbi:ribosomal protein S18-alanine N-acetyltransferase [Halorubrum ezzemoulense]|uniref:Ribosomal protein S18-alanine N-acetyltransferase n=1 Tax=Halorubrum ezzemoulense TaxID=337243 RepID=A0A256IRN2_HALEZ|nr:MULTISPECIES: ribosomal protein S18-alanine N-acetyltransferase [Halorubrum]MDB2225956.1 ribosomal protein S18-alanine N-acetyltransferase [Halorubrum ezzemoulense]MDB2238610.1 ribosomal protein S18-alanine N-acetyltransferase [Halorubrum ezzemoulense]MDB2244173.1 ribosomal protein S18-alanine N-acetyltransferase [Halorubrum ezzemoulense]MDB2247918.1 ribosomal protein S18-alanine N-acetyltransferase [Halorubrum ezzemoulense]MDB2252380.1 ribosomal protein S18-alanine N-acetyltransferase [Hal
MSVADLTVRQAERADLLAVVRIERACFSDPWPHDAFERLLDEPAFLVAEREGAVVGFVVADRTPNHGRDIGHVKDLAVHPDARGEGIGRTLLRSALTRLRATGVAVVRLEVREGNDPARSLYADEGFEPVRRVGGYYRDGEDALVLVVDLAAWAGRAGSGGGDGVESR